MKNFCFALFASLLLASCVEVEEPLTQQGDEPEMRMTRSVSENDPYKLELVQQVLDAKLAQTRSARIILKPTHLYVRFQPQDSAQVATLEALNIDLFYRPIGEEFNPLPEPDEDAPVEFNPIYSVVPANFAFPESVTHETIYEVYIQSTDGAGAASGEQLPPDLFKSVLSETLVQTGYGSKTRTGEQKEWKPSARFRFHVDVAPTIADTLALNRLTVNAIQGSKRHQTRFTNANGETGAYETFIGEVDYQVFWHDPHFVIRQGPTWNKRISYFDGGAEETHLDTVFTAESGLEYFLAGAYRALIAYYYENYPLVQGLVKKLSHTEVAVNNKNAKGWTGSYVPATNHALTLYARDSDGAELSATEAMGTTFHELGHASHWYKTNTGDYTWMALFRRKDMESWANGVSYAYMRSLLPGFQFTTSDDPNYTRVVECLMENGFTLEQIQHEFYGSENWGHWRNRLRDRSDSPISPDLVEVIFSNPNTHHFDMRDLINVSDASLYLYQPTRLNFRENNTPFSIVSWEVVGSTDGHVIEGPDNVFGVCFAEPGEKTIRATVQITKNFTATYDKTVEVKSRSIISAPDTIKTNYEFTATLLPMRQYPHAVVTDWSSDGDSVTITSKTPTSAKYTFKNLEKKGRVIQAKIRYILSGTVVDCLIPITVNGLDAYSLFSVINKPAQFQYNTTYKAKYMGPEQGLDAVKIERIELMHNSVLPLYRFTTWTFDKWNKTLTFEVPDKTAPFDYTLHIHYTIDGIPVEEPAKLIVSNHRDHI